VWPSHSARSTELALKKIKEEKLNFDYPYFPPNTIKKVSYAIIVP
jgi:hypothetical protein